MSLVIMGSDGPAPYVVVEGPSLKGDGSVAKYALTLDVLRGLGGRKQYSAIAQFYGLIVDGLILTTSIFQGLNRYLSCDGNREGDDGKFVFSRKPAYDYFWEGGRNGTQKKTLAPSGQVFVVLISQNLTHAAEFPDIAGWVEHWNWVEEDPVLSGAPVNWIDRYKKKIWTRDQH